MSIPAAIQELVERFQNNRDAYRSAAYNEAQCRQEFINPFFLALGWDMDNQAGWSETYKDVIHEDAIKIGEATKAPDYCFRIGGARKFFAEAKRPSVDLKENVAPAYQLRRYAWTTKLPLSVLTDFAEFAVYDCRVRPEPADKASTGRIFYATCDEYPQRWDDIAAIFSKDAVLKGRFDKFAESNKVKKGTADVDDEFLKEIESWRELLARNFALRNPRLTHRELNFAVTRTIDRLIFLRICEGRGIEIYGRLQGLLNGAHVYARLGELFQRADERYNSGLFHFSKEKDRPEAPDSLTLSLALDDKPLKEIIENLYYPKSPYAFSALPAEVLGQVYEQFLGKVIRLTEGHHAVVEEKPEVKKAGGVYYTPAYIVDYIVKNTVGKLLGPVAAVYDRRDSETPVTAGGHRPPLQEKALTPKQVSKLRILDPACGSGSFLIGAYQFLLDWHRDYYVQQMATGLTGFTGSKTGEQSIPAKNPVNPVKNLPLYQSAGGEWKLTSNERKRILLNNIYGVDIDAQAVETTKLSLLLKVLEGENEQTISRQLQMFHQRALPDLGDNIKCGNSLIGPDFYAGEQMTLLDEEERLRVNVFDWNAEFPAIMKSGGFDAVIGNPPWGASFRDDELAYLRANYGRVIARMVDSFIYFTDRAVRLAKDSGLIGFIVPSTILNQVDAKPVRELLLDRGVASLISLGQGIFGARVLNTSTVFISTKRKSGKEFVIANLSSLPLAEREKALASTLPTSWDEWSASVRRDPHLTFFVTEANITALLDRLRQKHGPLERIIRGTIQRGISPDVASAHVVSKATAKTEKLENDLLRPSVSGKQIKRYEPWTCDQFLIYTSKAVQIENFPRALDHLKQFKHLNSCREVSEGKHPWWALHRARDPEIFASPKLVGLTTSKTIELIYDEDSSVCVTDAMYVFSLLPEHDHYACMAVLQSKLFLFMYRVSNQGESRVIPQVKASKLTPLPYPAIPPSDPAWSKLSQCCKQMLSLQSEKAAARTPEEVRALERQIAATDAGIDRQVYALYGLTEEEIKIVEGAA